MNLTTPVPLLTAHEMCILTGEKPPELPSQYPNKVVHYRTGRKTVLESQGLPLDPQQMMGLDSPIRKPISSTPKSKPIESIPLVATVATVVAEVSSPIIINTSASGDNVTSETLSSVVRLYHPEPLHKAMKKYVVTEQMSQVVTNQLVKKGLFQTSDIVKLLRFMIECSPSTANGLCREWLKEKVAAGKAVKVVVPELSNGRHTPYSTYRLCN